MPQNLSFFLCRFSILILLVNSCKTGPYIVEGKNLKGYVIGKETCNTNETNDYWLIDFTYGSNNLHLGDTLFFNGITYTNVLKAKGNSLDESLKKIGIKVSIDYSKITSNKIITTGCTVSSPEVYALKEIYIVNQGEIR